MPQIGDALMDLAPRSLLVERGIQVDLIAAPHIAALFEHDVWFSRVLSRPQEIQAADYDAAILLGHDRKAIALKRDPLAALPWVSLHGYYAGPDFHRARFATQRLADLLGTALNPAEFARHSAQKLAVSPQAASWAAHECPVSDAIALAIGGVWPQRTYHRWPDLIDRLRGQGRKRFVLVGTDNGRMIADRIVASARGVEVFDFVGRTGLPETQALLAQAAAVVCADGGLMHLALANDPPVVALFNAAIDPQWRVPMHLNGLALTSPTRDVDGLAPDAIARAVNDVLSAVRPPPC